MAGDIKAKLGAAAAAITITLNALADDGARASTAIDNTANLYLDALVQLLIDVNGAPAGDENVLVYAYGSADNGTTYSGGATGADAAFGAVAGQLITNAKLLGIVAVDADAEVFESDVFSIASAFGGVVPAKWGIIAVNQTGQALDVGCDAFYQGIYGQYT